MRKTQQNWANMQEKKIKVLKSDVESLNPKLLSEEEYEFTLNVESVRKAKLISVLFRRIGLGEVFYRKVSLQSEVSIMFLEQTLLKEKELQERIYQNVKSEDFIKQNCKYYAQHSDKCCYFRRDCDCKYEDDCNYFDFNREKAQKIAYPNKK